MGERYDIIRGDYLYTGGELRAGLALAVDPARGAIVRVAPPEQLYGPGLGEEHVLAGRLLLPGCVNAHSHAFQVLLRGRADDAPSFRHWVDEHMYPLVLRLDDEDLETAMLLAFSEMARSGITAVGEFFYLHRQPDGGRRAEATELDELVIRTARRVGLRVALVRALYDQGGAPARARFREQPAEAIAAVRRLHARYRDDPFVRVLPAPHSLHGASVDLIVRAHALAAELRTRMHIHLAEQRHDVEFARERLGATPLRALEALGVVDRWLTVVHGCWLDREEWELLGAQGGGLAYNPLANMFLGDGITDLEAAVRAGVVVGLGCDGPGGNNSVDPFAEMRTAELLQRVSKHRMGVLVQAAAGRLGPCPVFTMASRGSAELLGFGAGELEAGQAADLIAVDYSEPALAPHHGLDTRALLNNLVHTGATRSWLTDVVVGGRFVVRERRLVTLEAAELRERLGRYERNALAAGGA
ncbi:MAG: formimidoylglutamate deiminase [Planctomycetota bacterium]|nr:MAG: formimidoylglutamate deiminase [Planctomycetota bacterium]